MLILTSFNSFVMPSCSSWKPVEPSSIPPIFSTSMDVCKNFPKATATWLEDSTNSLNIFEKKKKDEEKCNSYASVNQTNLPRQLSARDRDFSGPLKVERVFRSWVTPLQERSQFSNFKSAKDEHLSVASTK